MSLIFLAATACLCQTVPPPAVSGYVTRVGSPTDFDVNGRRILVTDKTVLTRELPPQPHTLPEYSSVPAKNLKLQLLQPIEVFGTADRKTHAVTATSISFTSPQPLTVSGVAIIDAMLPLPAGSPSTDRMVRADGYPILITPKAESHFKKPLSKASDINVNVWITYHGKQQPDGTVIADTAVFEKNTTSKSLDELREKWEYDPNAVPSDTHQSGVDKAFRGIDPSEYPPHKDPAMQARLDAVGAKLVPKYQFDLPYTEETRIDFRFYLVDAPKWRDAMPLPNGIVLVPYQLVGWMQNDSQLATVLADKVACLLEKQPTFLPATDADLAIEAAETAAEVEDPFVGVAMGLVSLPSSINAAHQINLRREQRDRVSIALMNNAGYDVMQAPIAWWLLSSKKQKDIAGISQPARTKYLYQFLGETWATELASTPPGPASSAQQ